MATPENVGIALATAGVGEMGIAGQAIQRGALAYFGAQGIHGAAMEHNAAEEAIAKGDWDSALEHIGVGTTQALLGLLAGHAAMRGDWAASHTFSEAAKADAALSVPNPIQPDTGPSPAIPTDRVPTPYRWGKAPWLAGEATPEELQEAWNIARNKAPVAPSGATNLDQSTDFDRKVALAEFRNNADQQAWDFARKTSPAAPSGATTMDKATDADMNAALDAWRKAGSPGSDYTGGGAPSGANAGSPGGLFVPFEDTARDTLQPREVTGPDGTTRIVYTRTSELDPKALTPLLDAITNAAHETIAASGRPGATPLLDQIAAEGRTGGETPNLDALAQTDQGANAPAGGEVVTGATPIAASADSASPGATGPRGESAVAEEPGAPPAPLPVPNDTGLTPEQIRQAAQEIGGTPVGPLPPITAGNEPGTIAPAPNENAAESTNPEETAGIIRPEVLPPITTPAGSPDEPVKPEAPLEEEQPKHELASTQANLSGPVADQVRAVGALIPTDQLAKDGTEQQPHITALFGLHADNPDEVRELLKDQPPITVTLGNASIFPAADTDSSRGGAGDSDVLKVDVDSPDLHRINALLRQLPHTNDFPTYQPHVTIAYLKPGQGAQYDGQSIPGVTGQTITLHSIAFSGKDGKQIEIPLAGKPAPDTVQTGSIPPANLQPNAATSKPASPEAEPLIRQRRSGAQVLPRARTTLYRGASSRRTRLKGRSPGNRLSGTRPDATAEVAIRIATFQFTALRPRAI